jgi:hypothetical protein
VTPGGTRRDGPAALRHPRCALVRDQGVAALPACRAALSILRMPRDADGDPALRMKCLGRPAPRHLAIPSVAPPYAD